MNDDRSKYPDDLYESDEYSAVCVDSPGLELVREAWAFVDCIRAEERERLAAIVHTGEIADPWVASNPLDVAAWLRAGGEQP